MTEQDMGYQAARRRVIRRLRRRFIFAVDVLLYVLVIFSRDSSAGPTVLIWTPLLLVHFVYAFDIWSNWIERATRREMKQMEQQPGDTAGMAVEKRKREKAKRLALSDDGELSDDHDDGEAVYYAEERRQ